MDGLNWADFRPFFRLFGRRYPLFVDAFQMYPITGMLVVKGKKRINTYMGLKSWKVLLGIMLGVMTGVIGISTWALETNNHDLTRIGLLLIFAICVIGSSWLVITLAAVFNTIENTLMSVDEIKAGLLDAQRLLREYEEASCNCNDNLH